MAKFLLSQSSHGYILSERFNQDPIEAFFGQQRSRGQRNDNPSVQQFIHNTQALIVQKSLVSGSSSSITKKRCNQELSPLCSVSGRLLDRMNYRTKFYALKLA